MCALRSDGTHRDVYVIHDRCVVRVYADRTASSQCSAQCNGSVVCALCYHASLIYARANAASSPTGHKFVGLPDWCIRMTPARNLCRVAQTAATALHMGMSVFKKVARSVGISRWPFRKRQSVREIMEMIDKHLVREVSGPASGVRHTTQPQACSSRHGGSSSVTIRQPSQHVGMSWGLARSRVCRSVQLEAAKRDVRSGHGAQLSTWSCMTADCCTPAVDCLQLSHPGSND